MTTKPYPARRDELGAFLNSVGLLGEGVEIGVLRGSFSQMILDSWKGRLLHLVDPFLKQPPEVYRESTNDTENWDADYQEVLGRALASGGRAVVHRQLSSEAVLKFSLGHLDWVFIDGNHDYEHVRFDLLEWWKRLKPGGLMAGHDYYDAIGAGYHCEVRRAVDEFVKEFGLELVPTPCSSFWIWKP